jgi:shikimate kinase
LTAGAWSEGEESMALSLLSRHRAGMMQRPIALAGFMGVGKSTIGRLLAESLRRPFHDTDHHVEVQTGRAVDDFFASGEEAAFRRLEARAVEELLACGAVVIALGGGALLDARSRELLRTRSFLVHLHVPWRQLRPQIAAVADSRPLLRSKPLAEVHRLYLARLDSYRAAALRITVPRSGAAEAAAEVLRALRAIDSTPPS